MINYRGQDDLTTVFYLRRSVEKMGFIFFRTMNVGPFWERGMERYGIEGGRGMEKDGVFYLTYTAVSASGVGAGL